MTEPFEVVIASTARRAANGLPAKVFDAVAMFVADEVAKNPHRVGKPLKGAARARVERAASRPPAAVPD